MFTRKMIFTMIVCILVSGASWAETYYVDPNGNDSNDGTSWAEAFATIQKGIDTAADGNIVEVNEGTYYETLDFKGYSVTVQSTDYDDWEVVDKTIIDANGAGTVVTFDTSEDANSVLAGFTITGGDATVGAGISCDASSPVIKNCLIKGNTATYGGGMDNDNGASPTVKNCVFYDNTAFLGGGMENYYGYSSGPTLINCVFVENQAANSGSGGGVDNTYTAPTLINCTFCGNTADDDGGGICNFGASSTPKLTNCIIWGNTADDANDEVHNASSADPNFAYCDVNGCGGSGGWDTSFGTDGGGNIEDDPDFANGTDPDGVDNKWCTFDDGLRIHMFSPCVDSGDGSDALPSDIMGLGRVYFNDVNNMLTGDVNHTDIGAYEAHGGLYGMEIESVAGSDTQRTVVTTGAKYVLTGTKLEMWRRVDPNTNAIDPCKVAELQFNQSVGTLTIESYDLCKVVIQSTKATFEFESDSFFLVTAKEFFRVKHTNLIADAPWNAPLEVNDRELDRIWTDGYGGSLLAHLSEATKGSVYAEDIDYTEVSLSADDQTGHMVFPPKTYNFEGLYGTSAKPFIRHVRPTQIAEYVATGGNDLFDADDANGIGTYVMWGEIYTSYINPALLGGDPNIFGYQIEPNLATDVCDFISAAHAKGFKVLTYVHLTVSKWEYPSGHPDYPDMQPLGVTLTWMKEFQEENDFDGWYFDGAWQSSNVDLIDVYLFFRQARTDIGDDGIIEHHNSSSGWSPGNKVLDAIMCEAYTDYAIVGEGGEMAYFDDPNDPKFRYFICDYGLSQAYTMFYQSSITPMSWPEKCRLTGVNMNGWFYLSGPTGFSYPPGWTTHFKPMYDVRKAQYADANPFDPDVKWPLDASSSDPNLNWFRTPTNVDVDVNLTTITVSWETNASSDSSLAVTNNEQWWPPTENPIYDSDMVTQHSASIDRSDLNSPENGYEFRIRSNNGDSNVPGEIIWGYLGSIADAPLVAHWALDDGSGSTAKDDFGGYDGTIYGDPNWVTGNVGIDGNALDFDGDGDYVDTSFSGTLDYPFTVSVWVKPASFAEGAGIVSRYPYLNGWSIYTDSAGTLGAWYFKDGSNYVRDDDGFGSATAGNWYHLVMVMDSDGDMSLYTNGSSAATPSWTGTAAQSTATLSIKIGKRDAGLPKYCDGVIDDVRIFDRALTSTEVGNIYNE